MNKDYTELKDFLEKNKELMINNDFDRLYGKADANQSALLSGIIFEANINVLDYMTYIPQFFLIKSTQTTIDIPSNITRIVDSAFKESKLTDIYLPKSITSIGDSAFAFCSDLKQCIFDPDIQLKQINEQCFYGCNKLDTIELPSSIIRLKLVAFGNCCALTTVKLNNSLKFIGESCFSTCTNLQEIEIPKSVNHIASYAFEYCKNLRKVTILNPEIKLGNRVFYYCISLTDITFAGTISQAEKCFEDTLSCMTIIHCIDGDYLYE